jgi:hypothetical protein
VTAKWRLRRKPAAEQAQQQLFYASRTPGGPIGRFWGIGDLLGEPKKRTEVLRSGRRPDRLSKTSGTVLQASR